MGELKIADVGLDLRLGENRSSYTAISNAAGGLGTTGWRAPEVLSGGRQTKAVDIFAAGCILSSVLTGGDHPFGSATKLSFLVDISDRLYDLRNHVVRYTENLDSYPMS